MSNLRVTSLRGRTSGKSPSLPDGVVVTGVTTSTSAVVGAAVTINSSGVNVTGVVTATSVSATNVSVGQSVTAVSFHGDGSELSGISQPTSFDVTSSLFI